jgi:FixJ family two-component response regulator
MTAATVFIVDDDAAVREGLVAMLDAAGLPCQSYESAEAFLASFRAGQPGCLILDLRMPGMSGTELQAELARRGAKIPIIFLTAHGDIPKSVQAIKAGAVDFMTKPADSTLLLERVRLALAESARFSERMGTLTDREREVMVLAAEGLSSKEIARALGISHRTVEIHRGRVMHKTGAHSTLELAEMVRAFGLGDLSGTSARNRPR